LISFYPLNASTGFCLAALIAGRIPAIAPIKKQPSGFFLRAVLVSALICNFLKTDKELRGKYKIDSYCYDNHDILCGGGK